MRSTFRRRTAVNLGHQRDSGLRRKLAKKKTGTLFTLTTNGTLLDEEKISFLNREMHNVVSD